MSLQNSIRLIPEDTNLTLNHRRNTIVLRKEVMKMAKDAVLQVRMNAQLKKDVEELYASMGTSFTEAVRIFAQQSLIENGMPFIVTVGKQSASGILSKAANQSLRETEEGAFERAVLFEYEKAD